MGVSNRDVVATAGGAFATLSYETLTFQWAPQIPVSQTAVEYGSIRLPSDGDWQYVSGHVWAKAIASDPVVKLQDDGTDITADVGIVAGAQTAFVLSASPTRIKGGSELQVVVTTDGGDTIDGLLVTVVVRPYPLGEAGVAVT